MDDGFFYFRIKYRFLIEFDYSKLIINDKIFLKGFEKLMMNK